MNGRRSGRIRDAQRCVKGAVTDWAMLGSHRREVIFLAGYAPFPVSQAELGPFRLSQLDRPHNDQRSQLCIPRYGVLAGIEMFCKRLKNYGNF
jgi:hypothetical protein